MSFTSSLSGDSDQAVLLLSILNSWHHLHLGAVQCSFTMTQPQTSWPSSGKSWKIDTLRPLTVGTGVYWLQTVMTSCSPNFCNHMAPSCWFTSCDLYIWLLRSSTSNSQWSLKLWCTSEWNSIKIRHDWILKAIAAQCLVCSLMKKF